MVGNRQSCEALVGSAKREMAILENQMQFQGLQQGSRTVQPFPGHFIECWSCFGMRQITITTPSAHGQAKSSKYVCFCNGCLAMARVVAIRDADMTFFADNPNIETDNLCYDRVDTYPERQNYYCGNILYDVAVCTGAIYSVFEGVGVLDNTPFCIGDYGFVMPWPHVYEMIDIIDASCFNKCMPLCFAGGLSPIISVMLLPVDVRRMPIWIEQEEHGHHQV